MRGLWVPVGCRGGCDSAVPESLRCGSRKYPAAYCCVLKVRSVTQREPLRSTTQQFFRSGVFLEEFGLSAAYLLHLGSAASSVPCSRPA